MFDLQRFSETYTKETNLYTYPGSYWAEHDGKLKYIYNKTWDTEPDFGQTEEEYNYPIATLQSTGTNNKTWKLTTKGNNTFIVIDAVNRLNQFNDGNDGQQDKIEESIGSYETIDASEAQSRLYIRLKTSGNTVKKILGGTNNDQLIAGNGGVSIDGGAGADSIVGYTGDDYLNGGAGNDSLVGGGGNDTFVYTEGNDTIDGYVSEQDTVILSSETFAPPTSFDSLKVENGNLVIAFGENNSLTFKEATTANIKKGEDTYAYTENSIAKNTEGITLGASYTSPYDGSATTYTTIDASAVTTEGSVSITGNGNDNYLIGSATKANSLNGGAGNDTLTGGTDKDLFIMSAGTDSISNYNFTEGDSIKLLKNATVSFGDTDATFSDGTNTIIVKNGANTYVAAIDINGIKKGYSKENGNIAYLEDENISKRQAYAVEDDIQHIDASAVTKDIRLTGDEKNNMITLGSGANTVVYNGGADLIKNYGVDDTVSLDGIDAVTSGASIKANENGFTIAFGTGNSLTFDDKDATVKVKSDSQIYTYSKEAIALNKSVTLATGTTSYSLDGDNTYNAVNAADATGAVSLIGNAFANTLTAGKGNSTLDGKDGNDNLYGGAGADVFVYGDKSGKDAIYGYGTNDSLKVTTDKIISGTANSNTGDLVFKIDNSNAITFKPADDGTAVEKILLADSTDSLTKDGRIKDSDKMLELFSEQKGRVDLGETIYSGVAGIDASKITDNGVTMTGGSLGGAFIFANNKKNADVFEYNGGAVSLSGYTAGIDKIDLVEASLQSFTFGEGSAVSLTTDKGVISLDGAQGKEVLLRDATAKNNSFSKMIFFANGVLHDKDKNATTAILSYGAGDNVEGSENKRYTAASTIKKITVGNDVTAISVQASNKNTIIDASNAGAGVSLIGGSGNDKFTGRKGADTFVYTAGKDVITNYEVDDSITAEGFDFGNAKITQSRKSVTLKFSNKNSLAIKSEDAISTININGTAYNFGKNAVISGGVASLTSNFSGTYKAGEGVTLIDGSAISKKNFTMQGTKAADTLIGGSGAKKKVTFKGGGATSGADSLVGGASKDTFFYAKNDTGAAQVTNFDYANDNVKIKRTLTDINKTSSSLEFVMGSSNTLTLKTDNKNNNIGSSNVLIKANNTLYWFEGSGDDYGLYTAKDKESKAAIKSVLRSKDNYAIVDLNYSTNLVKGKVANTTETVFTSAIAENYKIK